MQLHSKLVFLEKQIPGIAEVVLVCHPINTFTVLICLIGDPQFCSQMEKVKLRTDSDTIGR